MTAAVIFIVTYIFIGLRQIPRLHIDRPAGALVGAVLMIVFGVLTLDQAFGAIDMHTLLLLLGMMIITVYLRHAGFFELVADKMLSLSKTPLQLLLFVTLSSALLSALFVNDTICLLYTPIILEVTLQLGVNPVPYLLALATASNVGGVMTVSRNPRNMLIGIYSGSPYFRTGAVITIATVAIGLLVLVLEARLAEAGERPGTGDRMVTISAAGNPEAKNQYRIALVCGTAGTRNRGLQGFRRLERDEAALFVFDKPQEATFWMGSVQFPIDIIFIAANKKVVRVYPGCKPGSRDYYPSPQPVRWVLETAAGSGIKAGDRVQFEFWSERIPRSLLRD